MRAAPGDVVIPIVFPDYLITVETPPITVEVPDILPGIDLFPDMWRIPSTKNKLPELGHAGVFFMRGKDGLSKYYEYGRYDRAALGLVQRRAIPDVKLHNGRFMPASLKNALSVISAKAGQRGRIKAAYIEVPCQFEAMLRYAQARTLLNKSSKREPYTLLSNSCVHFMKGVVEAAGVDTPWMGDPRPNSYIEELRDEFKPLDFVPGKSVMVDGKEYQ
jgi:hypothetical protein